MRRLTLQRPLACIMALSAMAVGSYSPTMAGALPSETMRSGFPQAQSIDALAPQRIAEIAQHLLNLPSLPHVGTAVVLTPNLPLAAGGAHLSFWKPSFVIGTPDGGEAGVNFWNIHSGGHINVGFRSVLGEPTLLDCRLHAAGNIAYKIYIGKEEALSSQGKSKVSAGHLLLLVPTLAEAGLVSVELWPSPPNSVLGFLGCNLWPVSALD